MRYYRRRKKAEKEGKEIPEHAHVRVVAIRTKDKDVGSGVPPNPIIGQKRHSDGLSYADAVTGRTKDMKELKPLTASHKVVGYRHYIQFDVLK